MPMKNIVSVVLATLILLAGVAFASARQGDDDNEESKESAALQSAKITLTEAIASAEKEVAGGKVVDAEVDIVDGTASYAVEIDKDGVQTVLVDIETGNVLKVVTGELMDSDDDDNDEDDD